MQLRMYGLIWQYLKVFRVIVPFVFVNMMHDFAGAQGSTKLLLCDESMRCD